MIRSEEFDNKFDNCENIDEFLDFENSIPLSELLENSVTITLSKELKRKLIQMARKLNLSLEDTIKVLVAKEVGVL